MKTTDSPTADTIQYALLFVSTKTGTDEKKKTELEMDDGRSQRKRGAQLCQLFEGRENWWIENPIWIGFDGSLAAGHTRPFKYK